MNDVQNGGNWSTNDLVGEEIPESARIIFIVVGIVEFLIGVPGNIAIIITVARTKSMRTFHYYMIANLAVADLAYTGYNLPWKVLSLILRRYPVSNSSVCAFNGSMISLPFVASTLSLLLISLNRYLSVCHRGVFLKIFSGSVPSSLIGCALTWVVSLTCSLPALVAQDGMTFVRKLHYCDTNKTRDPVYFIICFVVIAKVTPAVGICLTSVAIWRYVRKVSLLAPSKGTWTFYGLIQTLSWTYASSNENHSADMMAPTESCAGPAGPPSPVGGDDNLSRQLETTKSTTASIILPQAEGPEVTSDPKDTLQESNNTVTPDEMALLRMVIAVSLCFVVFMLPFTICSMVDQDYAWSPVVYMISTYLVQANSCVNCVVYGAMIPSFRKALIQSMSCEPRKL